MNRERRTGSLYRFDLRTGRLEAHIAVEDGERYHPGGIALDGGTIWVPVAKYRAASSTTIEQRDAHTLRLIRSFAVDDHIGCIAAAGDSLIGANWDSRDFYVWDRSGRLLAKRPNPQTNQYQEMKYVQGRLVASGRLSAHRGAVDWLAYPSLALERRLPFGETIRGVPLTNEGMAIRGSRLYLLPEDGAARLFTFDIP